VAESGAETLEGTEVKNEAENGTPEKLVQDEPQPARWWETLRTFVIAVVVALGIRAFVVEPFKIPSGSMIPTLLVGDYILVNKFSYGVRMPFTGQVLIPLAKPTRGEVVVFRYPDEPDIDYIKRVVGVGGDRIEMKGDRLWVNGEIADRVQQPDYTFREYRNGVNVEASRFVERNLEGDEYTILQNPGTYQGPYTQEQAWVVPENHYFMMGDNRDNSRDSRKWQNHFVSEEQLKGRAFMIHWSWVVGDGRSESTNFFADFVTTLFKVVTFDIEEIRWSRIGRSIDGIAKD